MTRQHPLIVGLGGTLREKSYSRAALREALRIAATHGVHTELLDLRKLNLPMYIPDAGIADYPVEYRADIERLIEVTRRADAMIWSSATYHGTMTGVLKNALDFIELLSEDRPPYLADKAVGLIALSDPVTFVSMQNAASELRAWVAPTQVTLSKHNDFNDDMTLKDGRGLRRVTRLIHELIEFTEHYSARRGMRMHHVHSLPSVSGE